MMRQVTRCKINNIDSEISLLNEYLYNSVNTSNQHSSMAIYVLIKVAYKVLVNQSYPLQPTEWVSLCLKTTWFHMKPNQDINKRSGYENKAERRKAL